MNTTLQSQYDASRPKLDRLRLNMEEALRFILEDAGVNYLTVYGRVKDYTSFAEKVERKSYETPFEQAEDLVGLRVILYFPEDINTVASLVTKEFEAHETQDKSELLAPDQFGYRSHHSIVSIRKDWISTPNYRGLEELKAEIQIRTVLMHAWAEVEHKLQYKTEDQVPSQFRRKLFFLSAKFEEADGQFQELKEGIEKYQLKVANIIKDGKPDSELEFNLETFRQFLDFHFPDFETHEDLETDSFNQIQKRGRSFDELEKLANKIKPHLELIEGRLLFLTKANSLRYAFDLFDPDGPLSEHDLSRAEVIAALKRKIFEDEQQASSE